MQEVSAGPCDAHQPEMSLQPDRAFLPDASAAARPGCHLNKKHWNSIVVDGAVRRLLH
jgi:predicted DNA-binding protein (MmcQ/YjbR family)